MKKTILAIIAAVIACVMLASCADGSLSTDAPPAGSGEKETLVGSIPVEFPIVKKPASLKIMITAAGGREQKDVFVWQEYEKLTGVEINWINVTKENRSEAVHTALTNNQQLDLILRCKLSATKLIRYGKSGLILDLAKDGLLQRAAPNCWAYLEAHPDTLASVMNPDGTIYALPQVNSGAELRVAQKIYVNKRWLERVNMSVPTTLEELRELLAAFKELDANGNGDPNDEIPMCSDWGSIKMALYGSFGLANRGFHNETVDCDPDTGEVRFIEGSEQYREFLEFIRSLYAEGLIDRNAHGIHHRRAVA